MKKHPKDFLINGKSVKFEMESLPPTPTNLPGIGCKRNPDICLKMACGLNGRCLDLWTRATCICEPSYRGWFTIYFNSTYSFQNSSQEMFF